MDPFPDPTPETSHSTTPEGRVGRRLTWLKSHMDAWWYLPCVGILAGLDMFIWIFPTDLFLLTTAALRPRRWIVIFLAFATGSSLGMLAFAYGIEFGGPLFSHLLEGLSLNRDAWRVAQGVANRNAAWILFLVAVNPIVLPQPAVAVAVIAGVKPLTVFGASFLGRLVKYATYSFVASRAPNLASRKLRGRESRRSVWKRHRRENPRS